MLINYINQLNYVLVKIIKEPISGKRRFLRILYCFRRIFFVYIKYCYNRPQPLFTAWRLRGPLIKITRSNPENSEVRYSVHAFLRISLPASPFAILANVCEKGNTGNTSWNCWERLCGACLPLSRGFHTIVQTVPRPRIKFHSPFSPPSRVPPPFSFSVSASSRKTWPLNCRERVACETRLRAASMSLTH